MATTTLPLSPGSVLVLLLLMLGATAFVALVLGGRPDRAEVGRLVPPEARPALLLVAGLAWAVLLLLALGVAYAGAVAAIREPGSAGLGLGGLLVALLGAPFLIWTTWLRHRTVEFQKEGHMTDRIAKVVEQLGAEKTVKRDGKEWSEPNLEVRIGAILSLERIAQDSTRHDGGRDHVRVTEILCAYIRHNAPASGARDHEFGDWEPLPDDATAEQRAAREVERKARFGSGPGDGQVAGWARSLGPPRADIAEALKVLGRRSRAQLLVEAAWPHPPQPGTAWPFDTAPHLPDDPGEAAITPAALNAYANRLQAWREEIRDYPGYRLDLRDTNLQCADLSNGRFQGVDLDGARLEGAKLSNTRLEGANLWGARLEGASLSRRARLEGANLGWARLEGAMLFETRLEGADLQWARLEGANLGGAELRNASLRDVDLSTVRLSQAQLDATFGDSSVILPAGLNRPAHWPGWDLPDYDPSGGSTFAEERDRWRANPGDYIPPPAPAGPPP